LGVTTKDTKVAQSFTKKQKEAESVDLVKDCACFMVKVIPQSLQRRHKVSQSRSGFWVLFFNQE
jgi:hypothetical protein